MALPEDIQESRGLNVEGGQPIRVPGVAAGVAAEWAVYADGRETLEDNGGTLYEVSYVADAAITGNGTNYATLNVNRKRGGASSTVGTYAFTAGNNLGAFGEYAFTITDNTVQPGDVFTLAVVHSGTGLAIPSGLVTVDASRQ